MPGKIFTIGDPALLLYKRETNEAIPRDCEHLQFTVNNLISKVLPGIPARINALTLTIVRDFNNPEWLSDVLIGLPRTIQHLLLELDQLVSYRSARLSVLMARIPKHIQIISINLCCQVEPPDDDKGRRCNYRQLYYGKPENILSCFPSHVKRVNLTRTNLYFKNERLIPRPDIEISEDREISHYANLYSLSLFRVSQVGFYLIGVLPMDVATRVMTYIFPDYCFPDDKAFTSIYEKMNKRRIKELILPTGRVVLRIDGKKATATCEQFTQANKAVEVSDKAFQTEKETSTVEVQTNTQWTQVCDQNLQVGAAVQTLEHNTRGAQTVIKTMQATGTQTSFSFWLPPTKVSEHIQKNTGMTFSKAILGMSAALVLLLLLAQHMLLDRADAPRPSY